MSATQLTQVFLSESEQQFSFLVTDMGFDRCGTIDRSAGDPRDQDMAVRYFRGRRVVDISLHLVTLGLFLFVGRDRDRISPEQCLDAVPTEIINFDHFLRLYHGDKLSPLIPRSRFITLTDAYNNDYQRYARTARKRLGDLISSSAERLRTYGSSLLSDDRTFSEVLAATRRARGGGS